MPMLIGDNARRCGACPIHPDAATLCAREVASASRSFRGLAKMGGAAIGAYVLGQLRLNPGRLNP
jgi:hypothetical protein